MAVVSDAMYNARTAAASYVSSSAYYGYVPPSRRENQLNDLFQRTGTEESSAYNNCRYEMAMETDNDEDGVGYTTASCRVNNRCVIPEVFARNRLEANESQHFQQPAIHQADMRRRNRKRCNGDLDPPREYKKFREGGGNGRVYHGTGSTQNHGLAEVRYEPAPLHLNTTNDRDKDDFPTETNRCCWAAGNHSFISHTDCKHKLLNGSNTIENSSEYEKILFETHGCSIYHHERLRLLDTDSIEVEF